MSTTTQIERHKVLVASTATAFPLAVVSGSSTGWSVADLLERPVDQDVAVRVDVGHRVPDQLAGPEPSICHCRDETIVERGGEVGRERVLRVTDGTVEISSPTVTYLNLVNVTELVLRSEAQPRSFQVKNAVASFREGKLTVVAEAIQPQIPSGRGLN